MTNKDDACAGSQHWTREMAEQEMLELTGGRAGTMDPRVAARIAHDPTVEPADIEYWISAARRNATRNQAGYVANCHRAHQRSIEAMRQKRQAAEAEAAAQQQEQLQANADAVVDRMSDRQLQAVLDEVRKQSDWPPHFAAITERWMVREAAFKAAPAVRQAIWQYMQARQIEPDGSGQRDEPTKLQREFEQRQKKTARLLGIE